MKTLMVLALALSLSASAMAQAVILDVSGAQPGKYYYQVTVAGGGVITVTPISQVIRLSDPQPAPTPDTLTARAQKMRDAAKAVTGDADRQATAAILGAYYREIAAKVKAGEIKGKDQIAFAIKTGCDMLLTSRKASAPWDPVRSVAAEYWTSLAQEGAADAEYARLLDEVAAGLEAACDQPQAVDLAMIVQIIKLVLELLEKFFP